MKLPKNPRFKEATYFVPDCRVISEKDFNEWIVQIFTNSNVLIQRRHVEKVIGDKYSNGASYFCFSDFEILLQERLDTAEEILKAIVENICWKDDNLSCDDFERQVKLMKVAKVYVDGKK